VFQSDCNQLQQSVGRSALCAVPADLKPTHEDVKLALALYLTFKAIEQIAFKLGDLSAAQARHMNVVALRSALVKMLLALHVHKIKFVNQAVAL